LWPAQRTNTTFEEVTLRGDLVYELPESLSSSTFVIKAPAYRFDIVLA
jgi:hypothetical protein